MCGAKHGQIYGWDDAKPPGHPGCRCRPIAYFRKRTKEEIIESERIKAWAEEKPWENGGVFDDEPLVAAAYSADEQVDAVYNYQDYGYKSVNEVLRGINLDKKSPDLLINVKSDIAKIDSVFSSVTPSGKKIVVYRADGAAISSEAFEKLGIDAEIRAITSGGTKHLKPEDIIFNDIKPPSGSTWNEYLTTKMSGYEYEDLAYLSTSKKKAGAMKFLNGSSDLSPYGVQGFVELDVPEGVKFIDVDKFVGNQTDEGEILLNRGNKIVIDNVSVEMMQGNTSGGDRIYLKYKAHLEPIEVKSITTTKSLISAGASPDEVAEALIDDILPKKMAYPGSKIERPKLDHKLIKLDESETLKTYITSPVSRFVDNGEDKALKSIVREQGFDAKPTVVSNTELDKIISDGHRELYRGVSKVEYVEAMQHGDYFAGTGVYGNGIYTAYGEDGIDLAVSYATGADGSIMRMAIDKDAKIVSEDEIRSELKQFFKSLEEEFKLKSQKILEDPKNKSNHQQLMESLTVEFDQKNKLSNDLGRFAALQGYDAIEVPGSKTLVVLNRRCLYVRDQIVSVDEFDEIMKRIRDGKKK